MEPIPTAVWGFHGIEGVLDRLVASGVLRIPFNPSPKQHCLATHNPYRFISRTRLEYEFPPQLYQKFFHENFAPFMANVSRQDSYLGTHTDYPSAVQWFRQTIAILYNEYMRHGIVLTVLGGFPHETIDFLMFALSKMLGIKTVLTLSGYTYDTSDPVFFIADKPDDYGRFRGRPHVNPNVLSPGLPERMREASFKAVNPTVDMESRLIRQRLLDTKFAYRRYNEFLLEEYDRLLAAVSQEDFRPGSFKDKYAYFPLHYQPEASTMGSCDLVFEDQLFALESIARRLPDDIYLVVKEQPFQSSYNRPPLFFERLLQLDNVIVAPKMTSSLELIDNSLFVATINGTAGWEALTRGKPVVCFGYSLYREMPGAFEFTEAIDLQAVMNHVIDQEDLSQALADLYATAYPGNLFAHLPGSNSPDNLDQVATSVWRYMEGFMECNPGYLPAMAEKMAELASQSRIVCRTRPDGWLGGKMAEKVHPLDSPVRMTGAIYRDAFYRFEPGEEPR